MSWYARYETATGKLVSTGTRGNTVKAAKVLGVTRHTIYNWGRRRRNMKVET